MAGTRAAIRYAKALLSLAQDQKVAEAVNEDMVLIKDTVTQNKDLRAVLRSPVIKPSVKKATVKEIFVNTHTVTQGLVDLLVNNNRIDQLGEVAQKYIALFELQKGKETAVVTTAVPLSAELEAKILKKVKELTGSDVTLENKIDESIIGGFILRVGDLQYNTSIAGKLNNLKREFINN